MQLLREPEAFRRACDEARARGLRVGLVPTMGALHAGHLSLVGLAREHTEKVVASVFVNPAQFGPSEDFSRYPRQPEKDAAMLAEAGCDLLFLPDVDTTMLVAAWSGIVFEVSVVMVSRDPVNPEEATEFATRLMMGGIGNLPKRRPLASD